MLIDTISQRVCIPLDKLEKDLSLIEFMLNKRNKKVTLKQLQNLTGFLNFLCKCVEPGRAFLIRLYSLGANDKLLPHHHIRITGECRMDLQIWKQFLNDALVSCRPFLDCFEQTAEDIGMYSDASGAVDKGFGAYWGKNWCAMQWDKSWFLEENPSIEYLELFGVTVAILLWIKNYKNARIKLHCDNDSVCKMINKSTSSCKNCMVLLRIIVLESLIHNVKITAEWIATGDNGKADALSRMEFNRFWDLDHNMNPMSTPPPESIWPIEKIWLK